MIAPQGRHGRRAAFRERPVQPLAQVGPFLADARPRSLRRRLPRLQGPGDAQLEVAALQPVQQVAEEGGMQRRRLLGGKIPDQPGLHPARPGRLGEQEEAAGGGHGGGLYPIMLLTLLTDFGTADYYVAAVKGTVLRLAPGTTLVDVSHEVPPGDVETASFLLARRPLLPRGDGPPRGGRSRRGERPAHAGGAHPCGVVPGAGQRPAHAVPGRCPLRPLGGERGPLPRRPQPDLPRPRPLRPGGGVAAARERRGGAGTAGRRPGAAPLRPPRGGSPAA